MAVILYLPSVWVCSFAFPCSVSLEGLAVLLVIGSTRISSTDTSRPWRPSLNHPLFSSMYSKSFPSIRIPPCARGPSSGWIISWFSPTSRIGCCAFTCCGFPIPNWVFISARALSDNWMLMDLLLLSISMVTASLKSSPITPFNTFKRLSIGTSLIELFVSAFSSSSVSVYCKSAGEAADCMVTIFAFSSMMIPCEANTSCHLSLLK